MKKYFFKTKSQKMPVLDDPSRISEFGLLSAVFQRGGHVRSFSEHLNHGNLSILLQNNYTMQENALERDEPIPMVHAQIISTSWSSSKFNLKPYQIHPSLKMMDFEISWESWSNAALAIWVFIRVWCCIRSRAST